MADPIIRDETTRCKKNQHQYGVAFALTAMVSDRGCDVEDRK